MVVPKRRRRRVKISKPIRVRPSSPGDRQFDEIRLTMSASPDGLYFTTWRDFYYRGMRVFVTFPYYSSVNPSGCDYIGEVLSVDSLSHYRRGVAVRFLGTINQVP